MKKKYLKNRRKLSSYIKKIKEEIIFGIHPVAEALEAKRRKIFEIYAVANTKRFEKIIKTAELLKIPVNFIKPSMLEEKANTDAHQGIGAKVAPFPFSSLKDISGYGKENFVIILDGISDPHNFGAIIRSALCFGVTGIIIRKNRSVQPSPLVSKISAGALEKINIVKVVNLVAAIKELKENDFWIGGLEPDGETLIHNADFTMPFAVVIGSEGKGISPLVKDNCDFSLSIPFLNLKIDSLNASVAAALAMYEVYRYIKTRR